MHKIMVLMGLFCFGNVYADLAQDRDSEYGVITDYVGQVAKTMSEKLDQNQLSENEIYVLLAGLVAYDARIWSATLAFNPVYIEDMKQGAEESVSAKTWATFASKKAKTLYAPYVWRAEDNFMHADNIANQASTFGYDYTDGHWSWWTDTMQSGKARWSKPVYSNLTGHHMVSYSYPIKRDAVLSFNVYHRS